MFARCGSQEYLLREAKAEVDATAPADSTPKAESAGLREEEEFIRPLS